MLPSRRREKLDVTDAPKGPPSVDSLQAEVDRLSAMLVTVNDALFGMSGILARVIVDAGLSERSELAEAIEKRAGPIEALDHNPLLHTFSRAVRMNYPGGGFDIIEGGRTS